MFHPLEKKCLLQQIAYLCSWLPLQQESLLKKMLPFKVIYAGNSVVVLEMMVFPVSSPSVGVAEHVISSPGKIPSIEFCGLRNEFGVVDQRAENKPFILMDDEVIIVICGYRFTVEYIHHARRIG